MNKTVEGLELTWLRCPFLEIQRIEQQTIWVHFRDYFGDLVQKLRTSFKFIVSSDWLGGDREPLLMLEKIKLLWLSL